MSDLYQTNQQLSTRCAERGCTGADVWNPHRIARLGRTLFAGLPAVFEVCGTHDIARAAATQGGDKKKSGRGERIRTSGLYVPNVALYQAKLHPDSDRTRREPGASDFLRSR